MLNNFQFYSMLGGGLGRIGARVALVDEGDLHALAGGLLHRPSQEDNPLQGGLGSSILGRTSH